MKKESATPVFTKPLGTKAYVSIPHLPGSRAGSGDHFIDFGQAKICTTKVRDKHDLVVVQEKLDGSCVSVALIDGVLHPLGRAGWPAISSPYEQHRLFAQWVHANEDRFRSVLTEGERLVGEWLAQAHGTRYDLTGREPFAAFDLMRGTERVAYDDFVPRVIDVFSTPSLLSYGPPVSVEEAMALHQKNRWPGNEVEGVVYRVHRRGKVDFLAKHVRPDKTPGCLLPEVSGGEEIWNWRPSWE